MAYMSQETKSKISPEVKQLLKKWNLKGSLSVRNHSTLTLKVKSGAIDFIKNFNSTGNKNRMATTSIDVNVYWYKEHFSGDARDCLEELVQALKGPDYFDKSDMQTDYFHCSHYFEVKIGDWNRPYQLVD